MPHQRKAGHVRAGVYAIIDRTVPRAFVEGGHQRNCAVDLTRLQHLCLFRCSQNTNTERLGKE
ncbi:hypothetical protein SDC9_197257 [bioreactor metagenome]|uniref:Uncharacterized protein n=1 Tax=bioreactor metagenome TaxID=1076179 RepID=A0A645IEB0_9ZZZZ